jgi:hypothetical protein
MSVQDKDLISNLKGDRESLFVGVVLLVGVGGFDLFLALSLQTKHSFRKINCHECFPLA